MSNITFSDDDNVLWNRVTLDCENRIKKINYTKEQLELLIKALDKKLIIENNFLRQCKNKHFEIGEQYALS